MARRHSKLAAILLGGLIAGTIDIGSAMLINGKSASWILHAIASGLIGVKASFEGGLQTAALGFALQWAMSLVIAAIYVFASGPIGYLRRAWVVGGLAYGVAIFFVMNYVVVPLSALARFPNFSAAHFVENMAAMLLFGLIVAFFARE